MDALRQELAARLGGRVSPELFRLALTHPSAAGDERARTLNSNQRLEFLGDAIVGAVVADYFYRSLPDLPEGELTRRRIAAVRREALASAARRLGIGEMLEFGRGEKASGGAQRPSNLSDAYEALVGAIFLTSGWDTAREFVLETLVEELQADPNSLIPVKSRLQELTQSVGWGLPRYRTGAANAGGTVFSSEVFIGDQLRGRGRGSTKKAAEEAAATEALEAISASARGEDEPPVA